MNIESIHIPYNPPINQEYCEIDVFFPTEFISNIVQNFEKIKEEFSVEYMYFDKERHVIEIWGSVTNNIKAKTFIQDKINIFYQDCIKPSPPTTNYFKHFRTYVNHNLSNELDNTIPINDNMYKNQIFLDNCNDDIFKESTDDFEYDFEIDTFVLDTN